MTIIQNPSQGTSVIDKAVRIKSKDDLPAPSGGVITLENRTEYQFINDVFLGTDRIALGDQTFIISADSSLVTLDYQGTGAMFTSTGAISNKITQISLNCPNGDVLNFTGPGDVLQLINLTVISCNRIGTCSDVSASQLSDVAFNDIKTDGLIFSGSNGIILSQGNLVTLNGGSYWNFGTATFDAVSFTDSFVTGEAGTTVISGLTASGNINAGGLGSVINTRLTGAGTFLSGISTNDALWNFVSNDDVSDTRADGLLSLQGNATATTISVATTPVLIAGTWIVESTSQMTGTTGGRLTLDTGKDSRIPVGAALTVEPVSGGAVDISTYVAVNGSVITNSQRTANASSGNPASVTNLWQENLSPTDFVELFVANDDTTVNILVSSAILRNN
ncbi:MAG: hypothetical protein V3R25_05800 [Nitrosomonadaceae bacterium]